MVFLYPLLLLLLSLVVSSEITPSQWPDAGETLRSSSEMSMVVNFPAHGSSIYCEPGQLRATVDLDIDVFFNRATSPSDVRLEDYLIEVKFYGDSGKSEMTLASFYHHGGGLIMLPGRRVIGVSLLSATTRTILVRSLIVVEVLSSDVNVDIQRWSSSVISEPKDSSTVDAEFDRKKYFEAVYDLAYWSGGNVSAASLSGIGSQPDAALRARRAVAEVLTSEHWANHWQGQRVRRVVDVPCGDMAWMDVGTIVGANVSYLGMDIVESVVSKNRQKYIGYTPQVSFMRMDVLEDPLPALSHGDLLIVRALMIHQPIDANLKLLRKIAASGVKRVMLTTHLLADVNRDDFVLAAGHKINLLRAPYCVCQPIALYAEVEYDAYLGLWDLEESPMCFQGRDALSSSCVE